MSWRCLALLLGVLFCISACSPMPGISVAPTRTLPAETLELVPNLAQGPDEPPTATVVPTSTETGTPTNVPSSPTPTVTNTFIPSPTETSTLAPSSTPTNTASPTVEPSVTPTRVPPTATRLPPTPRPTAVPTVAAAFESALVSQVLDGDTIEVNIDGKPYRVRYIGMTAPDANQPFGSDATAANVELVQGKTVRLEKDVTDVDQFGRLLRYVHVGDVMVNAELVRRGLARVTLFPPDVKHQNWLLEWEAEARNRGRGIWGQTTPPTDAPPPRDGNCDPSYPDVCIPPSPPDLDCGEIPHRRFKVLPPDPHRFDGNHDGVGCESG